MSPLLNLFPNIQSSCLKKKFIMTCYVSMNYKNVLQFVTTTYIILLLGEGPKPPATLSTSQPSSTSTLPHTTFTTFPISPTSTASTPSSVDNQSSNNTLPITSNTSHSSMKSSCQPKISNDLLGKPLKWK